MIDIILVGLIAGLVFRKEDKRAIAWRVFLSIISYCLGAVMFGFIVGIVLGGQGHNILGMRVFELGCMISAAVSAASTIYLLKIWTVGEQDKNLFQK